MSDHFMEMVEAFLPEQKKLGKEFVVVYRHKDDPDIRFAKAYNNFYDSSLGRKYWQKREYIINRVFDLTYTEEQQDAEYRPRHRNNRRAVLLP